MKLTERVAEYFKRFQLLEKAVFVGVIALAAAAVFITLITRTEVLLLFLGALFGGGWASSFLVRFEKIVSSRQFLPVLPDLVSRSMGKRKRAGLSVLPNFETHLPRYSVNRHRKSSALVLSETVDEEFQHLIKGIMHDFVLPWYTSSSRQVPDEFIHHLLTASENMCIRLHSINKRNISTNVLVEFRTHVNRFQRARSNLKKLWGKRVIDSSSLVASYETFALMHPAIEDATTEVEYLRRVLRILLYSALPKNVTRSQASVAILEEILTCNLFVPLLDLLADPDFIYRLIVLIVSSALSSSDEAAAEPPLSPEESKDDSTPKNSAASTNLLHQECAENPRSGNTRPAVKPPTGTLPQVDTPVSQNKNNASSQLHQLQSTSAHEDLKLRIDEDVLESHPSLVSRQNRESLQFKSHEQALDISPRVLLGEDGSQSSLNVPISRSADSLLSPSLSTTNQSTDCLSSSFPATLGVPDPSRTSDSTLGAIGPIVEVLSESIPSDKNPRGGSYLRSPMPRPPTEGAESNNANILVPLTHLEPALPKPVLGTECSEEGRPRSSSTDSFCSIDYDESQENVPFSDLDHQFAFEASSGSPTSPNLHSTSREFVRETQSTMKTPTKITSGIPYESSPEISPEIHPNVDDKSKSFLKELALKVKNELELTLQPKTLDAALTSNIPGATAIKKFLRRASFSKKSKIQKTECMDESAPGSSFAQSHPGRSTPITIVQTLPESAETPAIPKPNQSPLSVPQPALTIGPKDSLQIPTAENPRIISISAPETSESVIHYYNYVPLKIANLVISSAKVCKEMHAGGKGEYFLYAIEYDVLPTSASSSENIQSDSQVIHKITKRRHREFVNLHSRLENNPQLKYSLKGLKDIPKRLSIPLAPTAKVAIEQRRIGLQHFLQQLLEKPVLHCSPEVSEFLGLEGDTCIEYVRHQPREFVPRIDKLLKSTSRVSGLVDTIKQVKSAIPRALSDIGPLPPMSPPTSPLRKSRDAGRKAISPLGSPRPSSPAPIDELDRRNERVFAFDGRPKTTLQLAMESIIEDHRCQSSVSCTTLPAYPTSATNPINYYFLGVRSEGDGCESPDNASVETLPDGRKSSSFLGLEKVALFDSVLCLIGEAFPDKETWFLDDGFQHTLTVLAGDLFDGWLERLINLLLSEHWCAFYLAELREVLWPDGKLLSSSEEAVRTESEKVATKREALTWLVEMMPESFYLFVDKQNWQEALELLLDSLGDPQLNRHLVFTALDLLLDALVEEVKDENFQKELLSKI